MSEPIATPPPIVDTWGQGATGGGDMLQPSNVVIDAGQVSGTKVSRQYFNWLWNFLTNAVRYFMQRGLPDYNASEQYQLNARVIGDDGNTYVSLQNSNTGHTPSTSGSWWAAWGFTQSQMWPYASMYCNPTKISLASPVSITSMTKITVITTSYTFPNPFPGKGITYRVDVRYGLWLSGTNSSSAQVVDATNNQAMALSYANARSSGGLHGSEISSNTYAAGATVTFNLAVIVNGNDTAVVNSSEFSWSPAEATFLEITPLRAS